MKINKYNSFLNENIRKDEYSDDTLDPKIAAMWSYNNEEEDYDQDMDHLIHLLETMFKNSGIDDVEITSKDMDLTIYVELRFREQLRYIIKIFEVINKLKKDILPQYDSEFEMWKTKNGSPLLTFDFYYDEGLDDDNVAF